MSIRKPKIDAPTPLEQLKQIKSYLFQLVDELENELAKPSGGGSSVDNSKIVLEVQNALQLSKQAKDIAQGVRNDANKGLFDGEQGEQGLMAYVNFEIVDGCLMVDLNTSEEITFELNEQGELEIIYE